MRLIKMFGLAAIAAVAAMAFVGASSAMAGDTLLCSNNTESLRPSAAECGPVHSVHFESVGRAVLLGSINVECFALLSATTLDLLVTGGPVVFNKNVLLHYTGCLNGCSTTVIKQGTVKVLKTAPELAQITALDFKVNVKCFGLDCDYDAKELVGHGLAGPEGKGHTTYDKQTVNVESKLGGFINCPAAGALDALFQSLTPLYIRA